PLGEMLSDARRVPPHLAGLIVAGLRTGRLPAVLRELVDQEQATRDQFRELRSTLAYPAFLMLLMSVLIVFVELWVVPPQVSLLQEFDVKLPRASQMLVLVSEGAQW